MNCPLLVKEITDLFWPACAQSFRTLSDGHFANTPRAFALPSPTRTRFNTEEPEAGNGNIEYAMHSARPVRRDSWSNAAIASPLLSFSNSLTPHTSVDGCTVNWVHDCVPGPNHNYDGSVFLSLGVLIGDGFLIDPQALNSQI